MPAFFIKNESVIRQLKKSEGFLSGKLLVDKHFTFWTLSLWKSETHMKAFRNNLNHKKAMPELPQWCKEASYVHWINETDASPDWQTVYSKLVTLGKFTKVKKPSVNHSNKSIPPIQWTKIERALIPEPFLNT